MKITYDISLGIHEGLVTYEGNPPPEREMLMELSRGDAATVSHWRLGAHAGTHVDAPSHFLPGGATVDQLPLHHFTGPVVVYDCGDAKIIDATVIDALCAQVQADWTRTGVLFRTANAARLGEAFQSDYVALNASGAQAVVDRGIRLVGIDYLSIETFGNPEFPAHKILLSRNVAIIEGLDLRGVTEGRYHLCCLPIKLVGADGAPARAFLEEEVEQ